MRSAWTDKVRQGAFIVVEDLADLPEQKTRAASEALAVWTQADKVLLMLAEEDLEAGRLYRNLPGVEIFRAPYASVYDLLRYDVVVTTRRGVQRIEEELVR
jgi:ribosomal protein L4